ncbi:MAG TPA: histidinol-phosphatase HisJ family protein [Gemmatimonadota bacterium]|nr:histidinol-phosphatase HisJ family protein [Gemmatimonadota bacterium]
MINYHAHDEASSDAAGSLPAHARAAADAGLAELCVTNHVEIMDESGRWTVDAGEVVDRLGAELEAAGDVRERVPGLELRIGAELEYRPEWVPELERIAAELPLDFLLGSVHVVDGHNISGGVGVDDYFAGRSLEEAYGRYFQVVGEMVGWGGFDVVAHFDLVKRFGHRAYGDFDPRVLEEPIRGVLERMAAAGLGIEINTSGYGQPPAAAYPEPEILRWAREAGVPRLTLGADSHAPHRIAAGLGRGAALAADTGWTELTGFDRRRPRPVALPGADAGASAGPGDAGGGRP